MMHFHFPYHSDIYHKKIYNMSEETDMVVNEPIRYKKKYNIGIEQIRRSERIKSKKIKKYLPNSKISFMENIKHVLSECQVPNCGCKEAMSKINMEDEESSYDRDLIDTTYHLCSTRHHEKCQLLHK